MIGCHPPAGFRINLVDIAVRLYRRTPGLEVRSAGTAERAAHRLDEADLCWADQVVVFEDAHERWIRDTFSGDLPTITVVAVADRFTANSPALQAELRDALEPLLGPPGGR